MSSLETSVTLEDVFSVVEGKRVPLAPELAGYLTLEVADGSQAAGGEVDPRTVYISEEGTVALVRPKKDAAAGDAEASVRAILGKLLEASGSATPALSASARRMAGAGLPSLVSELEAALIPVNRAAGRRALARLAREVKRVTLGVGRNASVAATTSRTATRAAPREASPEDVMSGPGPRGTMASFSDEALTTRRANQLPDTALASGADMFVAPQALAGEAPKALTPQLGLTPPSNPVATRAAGATLPVPGAPPASHGAAVVSPAASDVDKLFGGDEVDSLLSTFEVSSVGEQQVRTDLKAIAGLDPTPPPPDATTLAEFTKDIGKGFSRAAGRDGVEAVRALALAEAPPPSAPPPRVLAASGASTQGREASPPFMPPSPLSPLVPVAPGTATTAQQRAPQRISAPPARQRGAPEAASTKTDPRQPRAPRTGLAILSLVLFVLAAGGVAVWMVKPAFFTGKMRVASVAPVMTVAAAPRCKVALAVSDVPVNAEILLRMGQAPLDVERMPVGTRLEFVATAEGYAPRRAVIKAESSWDKAPDGKPRVDVPIQLDARKAKSAAVDPWPAAEPGSKVGGKGSPGTVHVVSNVRGAEVWLLVGLGPETRIEQLGCDGDIDVLLAGPPELRKRLHVGETEIQAATPDPEGNRVVSVSGK